MPSRIHSLFPTRAEVTKNEDLAYSDHAPIAAVVPMGEGKKLLTILSLNILGGTNCSGIHPSGHYEEQSAMDKRYQRIAAGLANSVKKHTADVVLLQEADESMVPFLQEQLGADWEAVADKRTGIISCYSKKRLIQQSSKLDNRIRSFTFQDLDNENQLIDTHNIWGIYDAFPFYMEEQCKSKLMEHESRVSVIIGDTNSRIAPLDGARRNLTTGVIPLQFNPHDASPDLQIPDYPDGGFYRGADGVIHQLSTQTLDFASGDVVNAEVDEETEYWPEYRMVMCLDDSYNEQIVVDGKNIFDYEIALRHTLNDNTLAVRMAADCLNNQALAIRFPNDSPAFQAAQKRLSSVTGFQFRAIENAEGLVFKCLFAPLDKVALLHELTSPAAWASSIKRPVVESINTQINKLATSHWYFRDASEKIKCLKVLKERIETADPSSSKAGLAQIIDTWEHESVATLSGSKHTNHELMGTHRNIFFSAKRPGVQTATDKMLKTLKDNLVEETKGLNI